MILANLAALQVVIPLLAAPIGIALRPATLAWAWATLVAIAAFACSVGLFLQVQTGGPISYAIGGWEPPWGIEYKVDALSTFMLVLISGIGASVLLYARRSVEAEIDPPRIYLFYVAYLLCLSGLLGMVITGDAFNVFVFLEISSLSSYAMIAMGKSRRALAAAYHYLILGTVGATFYVIGVGMVYMLTGTLNMDDLARLMPQAAGYRTLEVALAFFTVGLALKLALFPMHKWLPDAYTYAPSVVTAFLASTSTKVGLYVMIRVFFTVFGAPYMTEGIPVADVLVVLALAAMFSGSAVAIWQGDLKRSLAYSSVAQIGYMVLGVALISVAGMTAGLLHLFNHALMKAALFLALGAVFLRIGSVHIQDMQGIARQMPITMACFVVGGLSLIGVPLTAGFISKWYLMLAAFQDGRWWLAVLIVLSSLLAVVYVWRVVEAAYLRPRPQGAPVATEAPLSLLLPMIGMAAANIWFGIDTSFSMTAAEAAARAALGAALGTGGVQ
ncbi:monovalent cation/H+ antiporter subunit D family protein [Caenispirillum bisanense]|uniref:Multisubunit sodium/proton antiporter, MrpD subunit n=1 Tax=Caenispirillum bisanense TaxID=414052 RepID=A0A286GME0_9PROT|nr:monovalent cation/H+ antiporter subunit D family protein [Caenispirillum bisanense]SOD96703.1 multisubunit sodium/proton antiporter, MrpD subunit [Caenispirillum bisanense]